MTTAMDIHRAAAYVNLDTLEENVGIVRTRIAAGVKLLCVVKADAYGHGAVETAKRLQICGVDYLGVANVDEGIELRNEGITLPILVMGGLLPWDVTERAGAYGLSIVVYDRGTLERVAQGSPSTAEPLKIHIKVDTGMGRLGFRAADMPDVAAYLKGAANVVAEGLMTHFASSENRDQLGLNQVALFREAMDLLKLSGVEPRIIHMANSGAITRYPEAHFDMVRLGISLYGSHPGPGLTGELPVKQVMKFVSRVAFVRSFPPGVPLSYGGTYVTEKQTRVAYIPVGYADGYPRSLSNKGFVLIKDRKCIIVGTVCMDWMLVDVTAVEGDLVGEEAVLFGCGPQETITADELAGLAGTIPYEIMCRISKRVPRVYV